jgi:hypothetical protein
MVIVPASRGTVPETTPTNVDLPEPFSPTRAWISPGASEMLADWRARTIP